MGHLEIREVNYKNTAEKHINRKLVIVSLRLALFEVIKCILRQKYVSVSRSNTDARNFSVIIF
jgi:hypothetical protein